MFATPGSRRPAGHPDPRHQPFGGAIALRPKRRAETLGDDDEAERTEQPRPRVAPLRGAARPLHGQRIEKRHHRGGKRGMHHQHRSHRQWRARPREPADGEQRTEGAGAQDRFPSATAIGRVRPDQRRRRGDELRGHRHRTDRASWKSQAPQIRREISLRGADVTVIEEVGGAETRPHSGSSVHRSGNCALLASAIVSFTFVSAISYEYTPATA